MTGAKSELQSRQPAMMTLIAMGITVAYGYRFYAFVMNHFIAPHGMVMDFFWELATLIVIMLLGHWIEMNAVMAAGNAVEKIGCIIAKSGACGSWRQCDGYAIVRGSGWHAITGFGR